MNLIEASGALKRFHKTPWRFQTTFVTSLKDISGFVETIISSNKKIEGGSLTIDQVVFEPRELKALLSRHSLPDRCGHDYLLTASGREEMTKLLEAALSDSLEFLFVPTPKPFVIYADHYEYITFYANTKSNLNSVTEALSARGYKKVESYLRES